MVRSANDPKVGEVISVDDSLRWARTELQTGPEPVEAREARLLMSLVLGCREVDVLTNGERQLSSDQTARYRSLIAERASGKPFAYLAGEREFYGRSFFVDQRVLIPRPETEHLIEAALKLSPSPKKILDIGTGSGCIAITLAMELPGATVTAVDVSPGALAVARHNALRLGVASNSVTDRVHLAASDTTSAFSTDTFGSFDTIVSNPPYVAKDANLPRTVEKFEPHLALFADGDGLDFYRRLVGDQSPLVAGQRLVLELGAEQAHQVEQLAASRFRVIDKVKDLVGWDRVLCLQRKGA